MNRVGKTRAAKGVKKQFNEYKDFHQSEVTAHVCVSFMEMLGIKELHDIPSLDIPGNNVPKQARGDWLLSLCETYVDKYLGFKEINVIVNMVDALQVAQQNGYACRSPDCEQQFVYHSHRVRHEIQVHQLLVDPNYSNEERDAFGYFYCRIKCGHVFNTKATRNRHENDHHSNSTQLEDDSSKKSTTKKKDDYLYNYHRGKLAFGLLLFEFEDAIKEGDGGRLNDVYKFALLFCRSHGHNKYAYITLLTLANLRAILTPFKSNSLLWNRFYNKYGGQGKNIPLDLKMEQLNKLLKSLFRSLGANLDESNATRVANAIESLELVLDSVDKDCSLSLARGQRSKGQPEDTVLQITKDLMEKEVFTFTEGRAGHPSFPDFGSSSLGSVDYRDLHTWMKGLLQKWSSIYENFPQSHNHSICPIQIQS